MTRMPPPTDASASASDSDAEDRGDEKAADDEKVEAGIADLDGDAAEE